MNPKGNVTGSPKVLMWRKFVQSLFMQIMFSLVSALCVQSSTLRAVRSTSNGIEMNRGNVHIILPEVLESQYVHLHKRSKLNIHKN